METPSDLITNKRHFMVDWGYPGFLIFLSLPGLFFIYILLTNNFLKDPFQIPYLIGFSLFIIADIALVYFLSQPWLQFWIDPIKKILALPSEAITKNGKTSLLSVFMSKANKISFSSIQYLVIGSFSDIIVHTQQNSSDPLQEKILTAFTDYKNTLESTAKGFYIRGGYVSPAAQVNMTLSGIQIGILDSLGKFTVTGLTFSWLIPEEFIRIANTLAAAGVQTQCLIKDTSAPRKPGTISGGLALAIILIIITILVFYFTTMP